jgi:hypothetical protein
MDGMGKTDWDFVFLTNRKFKSSRKPGNPAGPCSLAKSDPELAEKIEIYFRELENLPPDELLELLKVEEVKEAEENRVEADLREQRRFDQPHHLLSDFGHWSRADNWTIDEGIALCMGRDPTYVNWEKVQPEVEVSRFASQYSQLRDLALRSVKQGFLPDPVVPGMFAAWAERMDAALPPELKAALTARGAEATDWESAYDKVLCELVNEENKAASLEETLATASKRIDELNIRIDEALRKNGQLEKSLSEITEQRDQTSLKLIDLQSKFNLQADKPFTLRERETLLKLVIGMAVKGYAHDTDAGRSKATSEIASDLDNPGHWSGCRYRS